MGLITPYWTMKGRSGASLDVSFSFDTPPKMLDHRIFGTWRAERRGRRARGRHVKNKREKAELENGFAGALR